MAELIEPGPEFFKPYVPNFNLFVIDENDYKDAPLALNSFISAIFNFENNRDILNLNALSHAFLVWFNDHPNQDLKQSILTWIKYSLKNILSPDILNQVATLEELSPMFATRAEHYMEQQKQQWQQFGWQEGQQEGRQEGELKGKQAFLIKTLNKRFGSIPGLAISMIQRAD